MQTKNIIIAGVGGQGTLLTSRILGGIARRAGYDVKVSEVHGMAQRGGSVVTYVRYGDSVGEPLVEEGQADILIAFEQLEALRYIHFLKKDGVLVLNDQQIFPAAVITGVVSYPDDIVSELKKRRKVIAIDARSKAAELGNVRVFNSIIVGMAAKSMGFSKEEWLLVIRETVRADMVEINEKAFLLGYNS
ncbi:MAG: indolepyruvate oxidoreductase subunit beta [Lachnospiraceae bacterium]|jgi:indolepyruvate ferredoxin oxidoreductase beta subunit|nr:indolepyruvate oxidoreductase subunit beta [Lachnospiraceae bacterium]